MKKISKIVNKCQFSNKEDLVKVLSLGFLPGVNQMEKINSKRNFEYFFPTDLVYSPSSKLFQLNNIVDKKVLFPKSYPYTSSTTKILRENFKELSQEVSKLFDLKKGKDLIIDIGSNDGNLLSNFKDYRVQGVTPENIGKIAIKRGIPTILGYFDKTSVRRILKSKGKAKIITATNVFAHIDNISDLMRNIIKLMNNNSIFISESHYFLNLLKTLQYDTIYHEHLRYYTLTSLKNIFQKFGLKIIYAKEINTHGGSIRVYAAKSKSIKINKNVKRILSLEKKYINKKNLLKFKHSVISSKLKLHSLLKSLHNKNKIIYGVGAPSRASTLINYVGLDSDLIKCICEIKGSYKIGHYLPGTKIPIVEEKKIFSDSPDYLLILSWHIKDELIKIFRKKGYKGKFIIPLPKPRITN